MSGVAAVVPGARRRSATRRCCFPGCGSPRTGRRCAARCPPSLVLVAVLAATQYRTNRVDARGRLPSRRRRARRHGRARRGDLGARRRPTRRRSPASPASRCATTWAATWCGPPRRAGPGIHPYDAISRFDVTLWGIALVLALRAAAHTLGLGAAAVRLAGFLPLAADFSFVPGLLLGSPNAAVKLGGNFVEAVLFANSISPAMARCSRRSWPSRGPSAGRVAATRVLAAASRRRVLVPEGLHGRPAAARLRPRLARPAHAARARARRGRRCGRGRVSGARSASARRRRGSPGRAAALRAHEPGADRVRPRSRGGPGPRGVGSRLARALARPARGRRARPALVALREGGSAAASLARSLSAAGRSRSVVSVTADPAYDESFYFLQASGLALWLLARPCSPRSRAARRGWRPRWSCC